MGAAVGHGGAVADLHDAEGFVGGEFERDEDFLFEDLIFGHEFGGDGLVLVDNVVAEVFQVLELGLVDDAFEFDKGFFADAVGAFDGFAFGDEFGDGFVEDVAGGVDLHVAVAEVPVKV